MKEIRTSEEYEDIDQAPEQRTGRPNEDHITGYAGNSITDRHGHIAVWLLIVYLGLFGWAIYYAVVYWGGLGPGLNY